MTVCQLCAGTIYLRFTFNQLFVYFIMMVCSLIVLTDVMLDVAVLAEMFLFYFESNFLQFVTPLFTLGQQ